MIKEMELRPCPFCGMRLVFQFNGFYGFWSHPANYESPCPVEGMVVKNEVLDIEKWNKRTGLFAEEWGRVANEVHETAKLKGWWTRARNNGELLMLMVSELAEALEAFRHGNPPSEHIPKFSGVEEELADVVIRIMDVGVVRGYRIADAVMAKMEFNRGREYRHGGKGF